MFKGKKTLIRLVAFVMLISAFFSLETFAVELETAGPALTETFTESGKEYFDLVRKLSDSEIDDYIKEFNEEGNTAESSGLLSWKEIKGSLGEFIKYEDCTVYRTEGGAVIISVIARFKKAEAVMTLSMASDLQQVAFVKFEKVGPKGVPIVAFIVAGLAMAALIMVILHKKLAS